MNGSDVEHAFIRFVSVRDYRIDPSIPLLSNDPTLLFTNSTIVPYKPKLLSGAEIQPSACMQPCFRANVASGLLSSFTMLGLMAGGDKLERVVADTRAFLSSWAAASGELVLLACAEDEEIVDAWQSTDTGAYLSVRFTGRVRGATQWSYGMGDRLQGRGATVIWLDSKATHHGCQLGCKCGRHQVLGSIVIVSSRHHRATYVESAMSVEMLRATRFHGDLLALPEYAQLRSIALTCGLNAYRSSQLATDIVAVVNLQNAGCVPSSRGPGYVLRKLMRRIPTSMLDVIEESGFINPVSLAGIRAEHMKASKNLTRMETAARKFVAGRAGQATLEQLCETFGLTQSLARQLLTIDRRAL